MSIRALTYNLHGGWGRDRKRDYRRIGDFLKRHQVDVALVQEMDTRPEGECADQDIESLKAGHFEHFVAAPTITADKGWYGNALLSRFPVSESTVIDISAPSREPRNILEVFLSTPEGPLHVVNTHKGLGRSERGGQMERLYRFLLRDRKVPLIVGGDINEWYKYTGGLRVLNRSLHPLRSKATFPTAFPFLHLDRMWCRPWGLARTVRVLRTPETRLFSDHYPLMAELELGPTS